MKVYEGTKLQPKEHIRDWEDEIAVVDRFDEKTGRWLIIIDGNFSDWYLPDEIDEDFERIL